MRPETPSQWPWLNHPDTPQSARDFFTAWPTPDGAVFEQTQVGGRKGWLYRRADAGERRPAVVFVHGGGWIAGDPIGHVWQANALAARAGCVGLVLTYRLSGEAVWPAQLADVQAGLEWVRDNALALGADPDRITVFGGSAGGHLAAMAALCPADPTGPVVRSAFLCYPITDLSHPSLGPDMHFVIGRLLGADADGDADGPEARAVASPVTHVHAGAPPITTVTGGRDALAPLNMIEDFHAALDSVGAPNKLLVVPDGEHGLDFTPERFHEVVDLLAEAASA